MFADATAANLSSTDAEPMPICSCYGVLLQNVSSARRGPLLDRLLSAVTSLPRTPGTCFAGHGARPPRFSSTPRVRSHYITSPCTDPLPSPPQFPCLICSTASTPLAKKSAMRDMTAGGGMGPMTMAPPRADHAPHKMMSMMHMTFFWDDRAVVLFPGWPGDRGSGMYLLCLLFVLALAALTEALALLSRRLARRGGGDGGAPCPASSVALLTAVHAARMGMAYLVMLAVMSFNVGVLLAAVAGHALGFLLARSRVRTGAARDSSSPCELGDGSKP